MVEGFLSTMLQDAQYREADEACSEEREARDTGTIYDCPDATLRAVIAECDQFITAARAVNVTDDVNLATFCNQAWNHVRKQIGSDLYLERAGHGAGFRDRDIWACDDRDLNRRIGRALSDLVARHPSLETYVGDDGALYIVGQESAT
ncbi:hypothetical protein [Sphingopyxis sp. GW247-27LB]|uniref:hypothetical protein n=1 Tax=Sphingopyxis sp. GW247-27LB TaxID=2012632 RepID=UPI001140AFE1|nr:hypothetical protein [Sphingopyxis sp. GW247-27LB]